MTYCGGLCRQVWSVAKIAYEAPRNRIIVGEDFSSGTKNTDWFIVTQDL